MRLFTWYDVETNLMRNRHKWPKSWNRVDVYNDEVVINVSGEAGTESIKALEAIFGSCYGEKGIWTELDEIWIQIVYEQGDELDKAIPMKAPLFQDIGTGYLENVKREELLRPIVAFHSYKGGVGRTLSLISLAREITYLHEDKKRLLVIDADIEAPGLTWMLSSEDENVPVSYLDVLSFMQCHELDDRLAHKIAELIEKSTFKIMTDYMEVEHYFLPVYRTKNQMMNLYSSLEKIIASQNNKYIAAEFFAQIGAALGVDLILIDLRAGITEFAAPFLLDPRVHKYFVSSTSMQSVKGTQLVLEEVHDRESLGLQNAKILLTMIPPEMEESTVARMEDTLGRAVEMEAEEMIGVQMDKALAAQEDYLIRVPFDQSFVSLGDFYDICAVLKGKELSKIMRGISEELFYEGQDKHDLSERKIRNVLESLDIIARNEITAEGNAGCHMLATSSIREIVRDYKDKVPQTVVLGAKGAGKTYIYKQLLDHMFWEKFIEAVESNGQAVQSDTLLIPLVATVNIKYIHLLVQKCITNANQVLWDFKIPYDAVQANYNKLMEYVQQDISLKEWTSIWKDLMLCMLGEDFNHLEQVDTKLHDEHKRIVFLVDGLEDLFMDAQMKKQAGWKSAVRALCQNLVNDLRYLRYGNIGIMVFARKDMAQEAVGVNFEQFQNQYAQYELKWTPKEALRLALWIAARAEPALAEEIDIVKASREALEQKLERLWGKKLGKNESREAASARWIIGALSDFSGQLQARDIVRFLQSAAENSLAGKINYFDRYLMPAEIKHAIPECSKAKYAEIKTEMPAVHHILEKLEDMDEADKKLPIKLEKLVLTGEEIARLESQGYLMSSDKKFYLPEIIRFALGFRYEKGARPKVLTFISR